MASHQLPSNITIRHDLKPGDLGFLTYLHGILYAKEYGWDATFEAKVASVLADFARSTSDRRRIWLVEKDGELCGSIAIFEASAEQAQLRVLLLHPDLRGLGMGRWLVEEAIGFCQECGYTSITLLTTSDLKAAAHLYTSLGFELGEETHQQLWSAEVTLQRYEMCLSA